MAAGSLTASMAPYFPGYRPFDPESLGLGAAFRLTSAEAVKSRGRLCSGSWRDWRTENPARVVAWTRGAPVRCRKEESHGWVSRLPGPLQLYWSHDALSRSVSIGSTQPFGTAQRLLCLEI
ncbi:unnamed protein product [Ranitomeya imitator]|uniref:Uncharacterized protein n=1 Tax=Ranitomeya imitator TaxID=111125 RepID=A0ABN9LET0_9NEOB|nr:unnamed protein product [Ranitomeya imitator]